MDQKLNKIQRNHKETQINQTIKINLKRIKYYIIIYQA